MTEIPPQQQDLPGSDEQLNPTADHGEDSYKGSGRLAGPIARNVMQAVLER